MKLSKRGRNKNFISSKHRGEGACTVLTEVFKGCKSGVLVAKTVEHLER